MKYVDDRKAYERLANAIIKQAADDFRNAHRKLMRDTHDYEARKRIREVEEFLTSKDYQKLTTVDGEYILRRLKEEVSTFQLKPSTRGRKPGKKAKDPEAPSKTGKETRQTA